MEERDIENLFVRRHFALALTRATEFVRSAGASQQSSTVNCRSATECLPNAADTVDNSNGSNSKMRCSDVSSSNCSTGSGIATRSCCLHLDTDPALTLALTDEHRPVDRVNTFD
jgi:hypothetical protein